MKNQKHTPAPWQVAEYLGDQKEIMGRNEMHVAFVTHLNDANAALICAAPDLLAACEEVSDSLDHFASYFGRVYGYGEGFQALETMLKTLQDVVANAEGRELSTTESKE